MKLLHALRNGLFYLLACLPSFAADSAERPEFVKVPLPGNQSMEFALIQVAKGNNVFSAQEVFIGALQEVSGQGKQIYDASHVRTYVAGTLYIPGASSDDAGYWALPMSRTEVTCGQYAAVMGTGLAKGESADLPKVGLSYIQVMEFMEALSSLCQNKKCSTGEVVQSLAARPQLHGALFARLPLEREWEFAARGAVYVKTGFGNPHPYTDVEALQAAENLHYGVRTRLREVGLGEDEHPCGLYDMLGNASEMVADSYQPEYRLGRTGGLLRRGGDYNTALSDATSFLRRELLPYPPKSGSLGEYASTGFRVVLGSTVVTRAAARSISQEDGSGRLPVRRPDEYTVSAADSLSKDLSGNTSEISRQLALITSQMRDISGTGTGAAAADASLEQHFSLIQNQLENMAARVKNASNQLAFSGLLICDTHSATALSSAAAQMLAQQAIADLPPGARSVPMLRMRADKAQRELKSDWDKVSRGFAVMTQADESAIQEQITQRRKEIAAVNPDQLLTFDMVVKHFRKFQQTGNTSDSARDAWLQDLREIAKKRIKNQK